MKAMKKRRRERRAFTPELKADAVKLVASCPAEEALPGNN